MKDEPAATSLGSEAQLALERERFERWKKTRPISHDGARVVVNDRLYWAPLVTPVSQSRVALVSSLGVHLKSDPPFDILDPEGDQTIRFISGDVDSGDLMATHGHVDTRASNEDINVGFPIDRLRELVDEGRVGAVAPTHFGIMGWCPQVERMRDGVAPQIIERLRSEQVDAVVLVPG